MHRLWLRALLIIPLLQSLSVHLTAGEAYYTGFENFAVGDDKIIGTDSWVGTYAGTRLHGVLSELQHGVLGIGNAAFIGGFATTIAKTSSGNSVYVRRPVNLDPLALGQEVATFSVVFGIKDSTTTKRDNFEFLIYNQANVLLGGVQMDNTTPDFNTGKPRRLIYRLGWNSSTNTFQYVLTSYNFLPETLEPLQFRINFRTNLWTASLSDVPIFQDVPFYTGTATRNLGSVMVKMAVTNNTPSSILPGDNYVLFDDYTIRTDPISTVLEISRTAAGSAELAWNEEAGYAYQVQWSADLETWNSDLAGSTHTAPLTQTTRFSDPTPVLPEKRFYRIRRVSP